MRYYLGESVALLVARRTNNPKVVGSRPIKVVCIVSQCWQVTVWAVLPAVAGRHSFLRAVGSLDCQRWWTRILHG